MTETPIRLSATTRKPETAPPRKEVWTASFKLRRAAAAVRILDFTATYMPVKPAMPEQAAPTKKASAVRQPKSIVALGPTTDTRMPTTTAATTARMAIVWYWRRRKAIAPS